MKFPIIILAIVININVFSQEKNAISIDLGTILWDLNNDGFGIGASYEKSVHEMFSMMGHISYSSQEWEYFALEFHGRWYPFKTSLGKFFTMMNLGYGLFVDTNSKENSYIHTLKLSSKIGWKLIFNNGQFIEPTVGYGFPFVLSENKNNLDISSGLGIGLNLGWVF